MWLVVCDDDAFFFFAVTFVLPCSARLWFSLPVVSYPLAATILDEGLLSSTFPEWFHKSGIRDDPTNNGTVDEILYTRSGILWGDSRVRL
jgi:hypothetical protein